ncbi:MAG: diacylglycerol/lipid kinase family protein [Candidatus Acidiferrales bacterium]
MPNLAASPHGIPDLVLVNPAAGGGLAQEVLPSLKDFAGRRGWRVEFRLTQSPENLAAEACRGAAEGHQRIFVLGGDGTFQVLLNALAGAPDVILGVIPAGGGNDLAAAIGLPHDPLLAADLLLDGQPAFLDAALVRTADGKERLYTGGGGVGLDAEAARYAGGVYRNFRGRPRYLLSAVHALMGFHSIRLRALIGTDRQVEINANALLLGVLNTPSYGAGLRLAPDAQTDDGKLDLVLLEDLGFLEVLALIPSLARRGELRTARVQRFRVDRVRIETDRPCSFHGDGEILGNTPVEITVVPNAVRILRPRIPHSDR